MSESKEAVSAGSEGNGAAIDPAAMALALDGASREEADAFLRDQRALISDQRRHLHEQEKQIHLDIWEKWLGVLLRLATLCVGIAAACAVSHLYETWKEAKAQADKLNKVHQRPTPHRLGS